MKKGFDALRREVIDVGLCTGCGTCAGICPTEGVKIVYELEEPTPRLIGECNDCGLCNKICPGEDIPLPELDQLLFNRQRNVDEYIDSMIGIYRTIKIGHATNNQVREAGANGGIVSALFIYALENGLIDGAIGAGMSREYPWRAEPKIATTRTEVLEAASSKYVVVPNNSVLGETTRRGLQRLGIVGVPCHVHAIRKMQLYGQPKNLIDRIEFIIGIWEGSNTYFTGVEHFLKEFYDISLSDIEKFDYRVGTWPGIVRVSTIDGKVFSIKRGDLSSLRQNFRRDRCLMCYDWTTELADLSVGGYVGPGAAPPGQSTIIIRTEKGEELIKAAEESGYIKTKPSNVNELFQYAAHHRAAPGYEMKKHGLHLANRRKWGWPTPNYHYPIKPMEPRTISIGIHE